MSSSLPNLYFFIFLGPEPSTKVRKNLEVVKKSKHSSPFLEISSFCFLLFFIFYFLFLNFMLSSSFQE